MKRKLVCPKSTRSTIAVIVGIVGPAGVEIDAPPQRDDLGIDATDRAQSIGSMTLLVTPAVVVISDSERPT